MAGVASTFMNGAPKCVVAIDLELCRGCGGRWCSAAVKPWQYRASWSLADGYDDLVGMGGRMGLSRDEILLDGIKESLGLYQRSLIWATTAAISGLLIAKNAFEAAEKAAMHGQASTATFAIAAPADANSASVELLYGSVSEPLAWLIAQLLCLVFGALALSAIRRYARALATLDPNSQILAAIQLYPSLATSPGIFFRLASVWLPIAAIFASWAVELYREHLGSGGPGANAYAGGALAALLMSLPLLGILETLRRLRQWQEARTVATNA